MGLLDGLTCNQKVSPINLIHDVQVVDFMLIKEFMSGIRKLKENDLTFDLLLFPKHLPRSIELVTRFPEQKFVLDHIGKPLIKSRIIHPWKEDIEELKANSENIETL